MNIAKNPIIILKVYDLVGLHYRGPQVGHNWLTVCIESSPCGHNRKDMGIFLKRTADGNISSLALPFIAV